MQDFEGDKICEKVKECDFNVTGIQGPPGKDGMDGKDGKDGKDGEPGEDAIVCISI